MSFKIKKHTADIRMEVKGKTYKELFSDALKGMNDIIYPDFCKTFAKGSEGFNIQKINLSTVDVTVLLIDFLSEILTLSHIHKTIFCEVDFETLEETSLKGTVYGVKVDEFKEDIKAVTYNEAQVVKNKKGEYQTMVVFDI